MFGKGEVVLQSAVFWCLHTLEVTKGCICSQCVAWDRKHSGESGLLKYQSTERLQYIYELVTDCTAVR